MNQKEEKLPLKVMLGYAMGDFGSTLPTVIIMFWVMNYMTDVVGITAVVAGVIIMSGRIIDAVSDPLVGYLSDHTKSKWGRRRPWMAAGGILLLIFMVLLFINPTWMDSSIGKALWVGGAYILINLAYTIHAIPYGSLTAELTQDYDERTKLNMYRMIAANLSIIIGVSGFILLVKKLGSYFGSDAQGWAVTGAIMGMIMFIGVLAVVFSIKEKPATIPKKSSALDEFKSYRTLFNNKPFLIVLGTFLLQMAAFSISAGVLIYYFIYIYHQPENMSIAYLSKIAVSIACMPLWAYVFKKIGKKNGHISALVLWGVAIMLFFFLGHQIPMIWVYILFAFQGVGQSGMLMGPWSILPDTVEYDYLLTGKRRAGVFYSFMYLAQKMGQAGVALITGLVLTWYGYQAGVDQTQESLLGIRLLVGPIPTFLIVIAIVAMSFYPITRKKYEEILVDIKQRESRE